MVKLRGEPSFEKHYNKSRRRPFFTPIKDEIGGPSDIQNRQLWKMAGRQVQHVLHVLHRHLAGQEDRDCEHGWLGDRLADARRLLPHSLTGLLVQSRPPRTSRFSLHCSRPCKGSTKAAIFWPRVSSVMRSNILRWN